MEPTILPINQCASQIRCPKHREPITLFHLGLEAGQKLLCLACFDGLTRSRLGSGRPQREEYIINPKRFEQIFLSYRHRLARLEDLSKQFTEIKMTLIDELAKAEQRIVQILGLGNNSSAEIAKIGGIQINEEQIMFGKLSELVDWQGWQVIMSMMDKGFSEIQINEKLSQIQKAPSPDRFRQLTTDCTIAIRKIISNFEAELPLSRVSSFSPMREPRKEERVLLRQRFSPQNINSNLIIRNETTVQNASDLGHYFAGLATPFGPGMTEVTFRINSYGPSPQGSSLWFGAGNRKTAAENRYKNIYDENKKHMFWVILERGKLYNVWNSTEKPIKDLKPPFVIGEGFLITLRYREDRKLLQLQVSNGGTTGVLREIIWKGDGQLYPCVGFYDFGGIEIMK